MDFDRKRRRWEALRERSIGVLALEPMSRVSRIAAL